MTACKKFLPAATAALVLVACGQETPVAPPPAAPQPAPAAVEPSERERAAIARFEVVGDGAMVTDRATGLTWMRCSVGQDWSGETCVGEATRHDWNAAGELAAAFEYAGHADWRLPTRDELLTITWCTTGHRYATDADGAGGACAGNFRQPAILPTVFPATPAGKFWSATPGTQTFTAWGVAFTSAVTGAGNRRDHEHVRLVRGAEYRPPAR